ncbi:MAG: hypothetical protein WC516_04025 [Patescibacteria group bacterium]
MDLNKIFRSKFFYGVIFGIVAVILLLVVFRLGMIVGFREATFSYQWGDNYHQNFAGPKQGFVRNLMDRDFTEAHGVFGQIIKVDGASLAIKGKDNMEKIIFVGGSTTINMFNKIIKLSDLKIDDNVIVIGEPDSAGRIEAKFIRVLPPSLGPGNRPSPSAVFFDDSSNTGASTVPPSIRPPSR